MPTTFINSVQPRGSEPSKIIYQPLPQLLIIASTSIVYVHLLCVVAFHTSKKRCEGFSLSKNDNLISNLNSVTGGGDEEKEVEGMLCWSHPTARLNSHWTSSDPG